jgi:adenosylcobinamide-phosphate synthase
MMPAAVAGIAALLAPRPGALVVAMLADLAIGDPVYSWHPVRLIGRSLTWIEGRLRAIGADGYGGGIALFVILASLWLPLVAAIMAAAGALSPRAGWIVHASIVYALLALGDLLHHVRRIERAVRRDDVPAAREAVSALVGRDTDRMDGAACRRAAVESLSENLADGFISPLFWYAAGGLPGLVLFKIVSTMDSMVGYKTPQYVRFGWCGARLDDVMNFVPARATWLLIVVIASVVPGLSGRKAWRVGLGQHGVLLGPNSGWSEAATAGAIERRIVGPIWLRGAQVTDVWVGESGDPPLSSAADVRKAMVLAVLAGVVGVGIAASLLAVF